MKNKKKYWFYLVDYNLRPLLVSIGALYFTMLKGLQIFFYLVKNKIKNFNINLFKNYYKKKFVKFEKNKVIITKRMYWNKNVNESKWNQYKKGVKQLSKDLKIYENTELKKFKLLSSAFFLMGFFSMFIGPKIAIIWSTGAYIIAFFEFMIAFIFTIYSIIKKLDYIKKYNKLDCNPQTFVKKTIALSVIGKPFLKYTGITLGSILSLNYIINDLRNVNVLQEIGVNYIDGNKSLHETRIIISEKIKNGWNQD